MGDTNRIPQEHILLIMNCQKYRHKAEEQKSTWLHQLPPHLLYFHVLGDRNFPKPFYFDFEERILWVKTKDDYNSLPHKVISAYEAVEQTFDYQYIFKTDDDQRLTQPGFFSLLTKLLKTMQPPVHYGGFIVDVPMRHISKYYLYHPELPKNLWIEKIKYCNGRFYLLSREALCNLIEKKDKIREEYLEDYAIGLYLDSKYKTNILPITTQKYFEDGQP